MLRKCVNKWGEVQLFVGKYHLDIMLANRSVHIINDNEMMHFRKFCNTDEDNSQWTNSWLKRLGKQLQRKKNHLRARDKEGK